MQTSVSVQQINHFAQFQWIEFAPFFSPEECEAIQTALKESVAKRLKTPARLLHRYPTDSLYRNGRDCSRESTFLKTLFSHRRLRSTVESLTSKSRARWICDQWVPPQKQFDPLRLKEHLSFQNILCACLIILEGDDCGNVRFFLPERLPVVNASQVIIAFGREDTIYIHNPLDPANTFHQRYGYAFGDRYKEESNEGHDSCNTINME